MRDGRWYLVGHDIDRDAMRTFARHARQELEVNRAKQADTRLRATRAASTSPHTCMLPFQFGTDSFDAVLEFDDDVAGVLTATRIADGVARGASMTAACAGRSRPASSRSRLARWVIENGPGIAIVSPDRHDCPRCARSLEEVRAAHD